MAGLDLSAFDKVLKDVYGPAIQEQLNQLNVFSDFIEEDDSVTWTGRQVRYPIHISRNQGVGAATEGSRLPRAGAQGYAEIIIPCKFNYGRIRLTAQVIKQSMSDRGAFTRAMESEMTGIVRDLANDLERQRWGSGTGVLALVNGQQNFSATTWVAVDSNYGMSGVANGARFLNPNMTVVVLDPTTDSTIEATMTVVAIGSTGSYFTIGATTDTTLSDNARIVRYNVDVAAGTTNNLNYESMGLLGLIDDGTYCNTMHNVNRTTYPIFKSPVISSVGALSLDVIQRGCDATDELGKGNFGQNGHLFSHHSVRREYLKLLGYDRRYTGADLRSPDGGTKQAALKRGGEITYGDRPWHVAKHCPYGTLFGILKGSVVRYALVKGEWADEDGRILRNVFDYDTWDAFYRIWDNLHTDRPNDGFRLDGINATIAVNHIY